VRLLLLTLAWAAVTGSAAPVNLAFGLTAAWGVTRLVGAPPAPLPGWRRVGAGLGLLFFFLWELLLANLRVAATVVAPRGRLRPGILAVPLALRSDAAITLYANLITLTPGTLSLDVSPDRRTLYVHLIRLDDPERERRALQQGLERRVREVCE